MVETVAVGLILIPIFYFVVTDPSPLLERATSPLSGVRLSVAPRGLCRPLGAVPVPRLSGNRRL